MITSDFDDKITEQCEKHNLEHDYGVHDVACEEDDLFGFTTYEVPKGKVKELMNIWKKILEDLGCKTGAIKKA